MVNLEQVKKEAKAEYDIYIEKASAALSYRVKLAYLKIAFEIMERIAALEEEEDKGRLL